MTESFATRFAQLSKTRSPLCVGLDPSPDTLLRWGLRDDAKGLRTFCETIVRAAAKSVSVLKPQAAFFERHGPDGMMELQRVIRSIQEEGALALLDAKRGDISSSAVAYAEAYLGPDSPYGADALTVHPYLGVAALSPIFETAAQRSAGVFVVVRSSNPEGAQLQETVFRPGAAIADHISDEITAFNVRLAPRDPVGPIGVVLGATIGGDVLSDAVDRAPRSLVLLPGIGAQGGTIAEVYRSVRAGRARLMPSVSRDIYSVGPNIENLREKVLQHASPTKDSGPSM